MVRCLSLVLGIALLLVPSFPISAAQATFSARGVDDALDLHGNPSGADLVIFAGGNQWMVMPDLIEAFQREHPEIRSVYYETLPPGVLARQIAAGSLRIDELTISAAPDVYMAGYRRMSQEFRAGVVATPVDYASNVLALVVRAGNPKHVESLGDLGRSDVRVALPNPQTEGIARQIRIALSNAGGASLVAAVFDKKVANRTALLTEIHHRQTPMWLLEGKADAGPVWVSEALYQEKIGSGLVAVRIPASVNVTARFQAAALRAAPHAPAAKAFVTFVAGPEAEAIYKRYGFGPPISHLEE